MHRVLSQFSLQSDREDPEAIVLSIRNGVEFRGANLWILIFAILVASLGLNVNSTAVIIGAMLISPLMGPIMGIGLGLGINDLGLVRSSIMNLSYAIVVGLLSSTLYFSITPLNDAHSELLARTYPTVYDALIAFFGGLAGIVATATHKKGNVLPGVAIATALMPPLCTAGYGLATSHMSYFFGAFYLFLINTVFIATATLVTARVLRLPQVHLLDPKAETRARRMVIAIVVVTLVPSVYLGYDLVLQDRFSKKVTRFIEAEGVIANDYLLNRKVDPKRKTIVLTYGGSEISPAVIQNMKSKLLQYELGDATLEVKQGFSYLIEDQDVSQASVNELTRSLQGRDSLIRKLKSDMSQRIVDSTQQFDILQELKILSPSITQISVNKSAINIDTKGMEARSPVVLLTSARKLSEVKQREIKQLLSIRLRDTSTVVAYVYGN